ncbi:O-methyltransferase [Paenibacillus sp. N1-5-1-14]|uniref:O-methyltransferase n=1 Tax=Paenibacillus radicibacter TaxID=2972488 RepID=UPI00215905F9|nr:O-methyltransferase [Paenibacillus radicibacter]MCR8645318.1 O-methyltransferase [Paenibacillus radicibacter]
MILEQLPLARQVEIVFKQVRDELSLMSSGSVFIQIRNNVIGKFGVRHLPMESKGGVISKQEFGLTEAHYIAFKQMAIDSLKYKNSWTHGEILFDFAVKKSALYASVQFESNYNLASLAKSV